MLAESEDGTVIGGKYLRSLERIVSLIRSRPGTRAVINISLGSYTYNPAEHILIRSITDLGAVVVAAAGNDSTHKPLFPAAYPETVAVAQSDGPRKAPESNYGTHIDIACPGDVTFIDIDPLPYSTLRHELKARGTSFSAPRVTACIAELCLRDPSLTPHEAVSIIHDTAVSLTGDVFFKKGMLGAGVMSRFRALRRVDPFHVSATVILPLVMAAAAAAATVFLTFRYGWTGFALAAALSVIVIPTLIMYGLVSAELIRYIRQWSIRNGYGPEEWLCAGAGIAGAAFLSRNKPGYFLKSLVICICTVIILNFIHALDPLVTTLLPAAGLPAAAVAQRAGGFFRKAHLQAAGARAIPELEKLYAKSKTPGTVLFITQVLSKIHIPESAVLLVSIWEDEISRFEPFKDTGCFRKKRKQKHETVTAYIRNALCELVRVDPGLLQPALSGYESLAGQIRTGLFQAASESGSSEFKRMIEEASMQYSGDEQVR